MSKFGVLCLYSAVFCLELENVHKTHNLSYKDRLKKLNSYSLVRGRKRRGLIQVFKILKNLENIDEEISFNRSSTTNLRGHYCKLLKGDFKKLCP